MALRKKRKPDFYTLNIVKESSKKKLAIEKVDVPVQLSTSSGHELKDAPSQLEPSVQNITSVDAGNAILDWDDPATIDHCSPFNDVDEHNSDVNESDENEDNVAISQHKKRKLKSAKAWKSLRDSVYEHVVKSYAPLSTTCFLCDKEAKVKCPQCGPITYYCVQCAKELHTNHFVFHSPQLWKVINFKDLFC